MSIYNSLCSLVSQTSETFCSDARIYAYSEFHQGSVNGSSGVVDFWLRLLAAQIMGVQD